ncbi:MAG: hypothetical protein RDV48_21775 [Candidatus Eremiobacteraeota bacterium]|nr:hypothetical protein [Candidatus Eremiobacteraeota bacterium]
MGRKEEAARCLDEALKLDGKNNRAINWKAIVEKNLEPPPGEAEAPEPSREQVKKTPGKAKTQNP